MTSSTPHGFRRWRRTRPFWGGLLAVLGGLEIIAIPLAPMPVVIHQGLAGIASWLFGALLVVAGLLLWFQPAQRTFFGVLAVLLSLGSFLTSNFGGFLLGMLLGLLGGALGFAWTPGATKRRRAIPPDAAGAAGSGGTAGSADAVGSPDAAVLVDAKNDPFEGRGVHAAPRGGKILGLALPLAAAPALLGGHLLAAPSPSPTPPAPSASPSPSAPSASPSPSAPSANPSAQPTAKPQPQAKSAGTVPGAYSDVATLRASSLAMSGLSYDGVADLQTPDGTVKALKFSMDKAVLKDVDQQVRRGSAAAGLTTPRLTLTGDVVMYTTKMSSKLLGIPLTFTPESPPPLVLPSMTMTDVVSEQPAVSARDAEAAALSIRSA
ncbi:DUF6114 domain-containing protein [Actinomadura gamaensis]|uniref:DUF6114 domain-containing protein n=1 Tax=Actinomadura gamaensis TaxID=1763541 RepID=A0ABV9U1G8_9ACTN